MSACTYLRVTLGADNLSKLLLLSLLDNEASALGLLLLCGAMGRRGAGMKSCQ